MKKANLFIQTAFLGDLILSVPTLRRIKQMNPDELLVVICKKGLGEFLLKNEIVDKVIEVNKGDSDSYSRAIQLLTDFSIKNLYCPHRSIRSSIFSARIRAEKKIGFNSFLNFWIFDDLIEFDTDPPEVIRQLKILETTDNPMKELLEGRNWNQFHDQIHGLPLGVSFQNKRYTRFETAPFKAAIFPGSVWATKRWTEEGFRELSRKLVECGFEVQLFGSEVEKPLCDRIAEIDSRIQVKAGVYSISETIDVIAQFDVVVSNDSAPTHMAAFKGTPVVTIFGPTTSRMGFRPWSEFSEIVESEKVPCRPCGPHGHEKCPLGHHNCMKSVTAAEVFEKVLKLTVEHRH